MSRTPSLCGSKSQSVPIAATARPVFHRFRVCPLRSDPFRHRPARRRFPLLPVRIPSGPVPAIPSAAARARTSLAPSRRCCLSLPGPVSSAMPTGSPSIRRPYGRHDPHRPPQRRLSALRRSCRLPEERDADHFCQADAWTQDAGKKSRKIRAGIVDGIMQ